MRDTGLKEPPEDEWLPLVDLSEADLKEEWMEKLNVEVGEYLAARLAAKQAQIVCNAVKIEPSDYHGEYLVARLVSEKPDIWAQVKRGEFLSIRAAAREAGISIIDAPGMTTGILLDAE